MQQFRTANPGGHRTGACGWLLVILAIAGFLPAHAQNKGVSAESARVTASVPRGAVMSGLDEQALGKRFPDAALWLDFENGTRALALLWPGYEAPARGGVIVLADEGGNAEAGLTGALARELARRNLAVLTLGLASPSPALERILDPPVAGTDLPHLPGDQNQGAATSATIDVMASASGNDLEAVYRERIRETLVAGASALGARGQEVLAVVGIGRGSNHVVVNAAELSGAPAMVWISPTFYPEDASRLADRLEKHPVPRVLALSSSDERRAGFMRIKVEDFSHQRVGPGDLSTPGHGKALAGRISAWLKPKQP
ncbi:MAG: hypothetical protein ACTHYN_01530 [Marinobacter sp.]|uniref:hypothetical protein n=1 Tax=Marinobacter sp. TaxID=50741 RepID=UPI003F95EED9